MVSSTAKTPAAYLAELPPERRAIIAALRERILKRLPSGYEEVMLWGMLVYVIPLARYPNTYNGQPLAYVALAAQKNAYSLYLNMAYGNNTVENEFRAAYVKAGKKLDMGKCCVRFKKLDDLLLDAVDNAIASTPLSAYLDGYERVMAATKTGQRQAARKQSPKAETAKTPARKASAKSVAASKPAAKKPAVKKTASKKPAATTRAAAKPAAATTVAARKRPR
ncbi:DUF1801 domain-containing protein [Ahniella affigens]|uniref:DUF1801 domain-containing protein n=1 Tax=Ahniella affigens TaxID=2021234 RepID=A0A2P1PYE1_9GAMM|nr:DUF1801 domain-containing protein [Ahniella affigens]AVP99856.1 DUF1801 domain-containing protein [Ahniella affigens]